MRGTTIALLLAGIAAPAAAEGGGAPREMRCHLLLAGRPAAEATVYTVGGADLFSASDGERRRISVSGPGGPLFLSTTTDRGIATRSYADHVRTGDVVTRRVYWQPAGKPRRLAFTERYDFAAKTVHASGERGDICHANGR